MPVVHREILEKAAKGNDLKTLLSLTDQPPHNHRNTGNEEDVRYLRSSAHFNPFYLHQQSQSTQQQQSHHHLMVPRALHGEGGASHSHRHSHTSPLMTDSVESNGSISLALPAMGAPPYVSSPHTTGLVHKPPPLISNNWTTTALAMNTAFKNNQQHPSHRSGGGGGGGIGGGGGLEKGLTNRARPPFLTKELALVPQPAVRLGASATGHSL